MEPRSVWSFQLPSDAPAHAVLPQKVADVLVLAGSALNTVSELQRHRWKRRPENAGHLYTGGLFRYGAEYRDYARTVKRFVPYLY